MSARDEEEDEKFYRDTETVAFPKIDDRQLALLEPLGERRKVHRGEMIFKAGERDLPLTVILSGEIEVGAGVRIDVGCCDEMLHAALAAGCRYDEDEVLSYTAAVAYTLALQPHSEPQVGLGWAR